MDGRWTVVHGRGSIEPPSKVNRPAWLKTRLMLCYYRRKRGWEGCWGGRGDTGGERILEYIDNELFDNKMNRFNDY